MTTPPDGFFDTRISRAAFIAHRRGQERWAGLEQLGLRVAGITPPGTPR